MGVGQWWPLGNKTLNLRLRTCARAREIAHRLPHQVEIYSESLIAASIAGALGVNSNRGHGFRLKRDVMGAAAAKIERFLNLIRLLDLNKKAHLKVRYLLLLLEHLQEFLVR